MSWTRIATTLAALALAAPLFAACAHSSAPTPLDGDPSKGPADDGQSICLLHNCDSDAECASCSDGRNTCLVAQHRCVACDSATGTGCPDGEYCSSFGSCVPNGQSCATDAHGVPTISCASSADCVACDPMHQVCDTGTSKCVACTDIDSSACQATDICVNDECSAKCPNACSSDNDCSMCGGPGHEAHACNAHKCSQCSATYACPAGQTCSPQGMCESKCGTDGAGTCNGDGDCGGCGPDAGECHKPINSSGKCGPQAAGCSDLGMGVAVLPDPWDSITNTCSNDGDCAGVGIQLNVGKILRDVTGIGGIHDANIDYGMHVCADVTVGVGNKQVSCGVCVPCRVDTDCQDIDVDQVASDAFGPVGDIAAKLLMDQVFGPNDHKIHMYCQNVAGDYGVCAPCANPLASCGVGKQDADPNEGSSSSGTGGGPASCDHDTCTAGAALDTSCDACSQAVCNVDGYCCSTAWDQTCVGEVDQYCDTPCGGGSSTSSSSTGSGGGGGPTCDHDECTPGNALDPNCSACASSLCAADNYCCQTAWDSTCVNEVAQYCGGGCGGAPQCYSASDCNYPDGCRADGTCGPCSDDSDCSPYLCDSGSGQCY